MRCWKDGRMEEDGKKWKNGRWKVEMRRRSQDGSIRLCVTINCEWVTHKFIYWAGSGIYDDFPFLQSGRRWKKMEEDGRWI
jgi:hypothetical protein